MNPYTCKVCNEYVVDPICFRCYKKELIIWLLENVRDKTIITYIIRKINRNFYLDNFGISHCIICQKERLFVCKKCYVNSLKSIFQEINIPDYVFRSFSTIFDYSPLSKKNKIEMRII